jgi:polyisoprenoid-binding protein YceI
LQIVQSPIFNPQSPAAISLIISLPFASRNLTFRRQHPAQPEKGVTVKCVDLEQGEAMKNVNKHMKWVGFAAVSAFVLAACAPAAPAPAPAQAPAQQQAAQVMPAATETSVMPTAAPAATTAPAQTETQAQAPAAATEPLTLKIVPNESKASYTAAKTLLNRDNRIEDIIGISPNVNGEIKLDLANPANTTVGKITIDVASFNSGSDRRDNDMNREWFNIAQFPLISFDPKSMEGLPATYETGQELSFKMTGDMTLLDKVAPVTFDVKAKYDGDQLVGTAVTPVTISSFGIQAPSALGIFSVADEIKVQFDFVAKP